MASAAPPKPGRAPHKAFGALSLPGYRIYLATFALTMMADNVEHVISYWVVFQKFHSAALGGFAVVSHWLPYLIFSVAVGALNDRFDSRRIIQAGAVLFAIVSAGRATSLSPTRCRCGTPWCCSSFMAAPASCG